jgi:hypothetical protein
MPSPSRLSRTVRREPTPLQLVPFGRCFLALPGAGAPFDTAWLTAVMRDLARRHERVLLLLEAELGCYDRHAKPRGEQTFCLGPAELDDEVNAVTLRRWRELDLVRRRLPQTIAHRVQLASWSHFIDPSFVSLWRHLLAAFADDSAFREDVLRMASERQRRGGAGAEVRVATLRAIESLAMRVRVGEIAGYHHEYGSGRDARLATALFRGDYASEGLTVESLVGHPSRREYRQLR